MGLYISEAVELLSGLDSVVWSEATRAPDDGWILSWIDSSRSLVTQRFDADGSPVSDKILLHAGDNVSSGKIGMLSDGGWVQLFTTSGTGGNLQHVVRYSEDGVLMSSHVEGPGPYSGPFVLSDDHYVSFSQWGYEASATFFDEDGQVIRSIELGLSGSAGISPTVLPTGDISVFLEGEGEHGRYLLLDGDGTVLKSIDVAEGAKLTFNADGSYRILLETYSFDEHRRDRVVEYYDADGLLTSIVTQPPMEYAPTALLWVQSYRLGNGNEIVLWSPEYGVSSNASVRMRLFDADGQLLVSDVALDDFPWSDDVRFTELSTGAWVLTMGGTMQLFNADGSAHGVPGPIAGSSIFIPDDDGGWFNSYFGSRDGGASYGFYTRTFLPNDINNAPLVLNDGFIFATEDTPFHFHAGNFGGFDPDGDLIAQIVVEGLPSAGSLTFDGKAIGTGQVIDLDLINDLVWIPPKDGFRDVPGIIRYNVVDEHGARSIKPVEIKALVTGTDDATLAEDLTLTVREDEKFHITRAMLPITDVDDTAISKLDITTIVNNGNLVSSLKTVQEHAVLEMDGLDWLYFTSARDGYGDGYARFTVKYQSWGDESFTDEYLLEINVLPVNDAPIAYGSSLAVNAGKKARLTDYYIGLSDVEGDSVKSIVIDSLPAAGRLKLGGRAVGIGDEIASDQIFKLTYEAPRQAAPREKYRFDFYIRDDGGTENGGDDLSDKATKFEFFVMKQPVRHGSTGNDALTGQRGDEIFYGGAGNDMLDGQRGDDIFFGGTGKDVFRFGPRSGQDLIVDFDLQRDKIDLRHTDVPDFAYLKAHHLKLNDDPLIIASGKRPGSVDAVHIVGISFHDLTPDHFIF